MSKKPTILLLDLETAPVLASVWGLFDQDIPLNMINSDWFILSFAAKYYTGPDGTVYGPHSKVMYEDQSKASNIENDKALLKKLWTLVDSADILLTQNGVNFDHKKMNARFILNGLPPTSPVRHIDTLKIAKKHFAFTSNKLEYMTSKLCTKYKKLKHKKFPGFELWKECLAGNKEAWKEMKKYNTYDILSLQELFHKLSPWDNSININTYHDDENLTMCMCGSDSFTKKGFAYTSTGRYQRYVCNNCGSNVRGKTNLLSKEHRKNLKGKV